MGKIDSKALGSGLEDSDPFNTSQNWQPITRHSGPSKHPPSGRPYLRGWHFNPLDEPYRPIPGSVAQ
jgi:hypothetical protein